jgi:hypothetical protein
MAVIGDAWETAAPQASRSLSTEHRDYLRNESGLTDEIIDTRGYYTLTKDNVQTLVSLEVVHPYVQQAEAWLGIPIFRPDSTKHGEIVRVFGGAAKSKYVWPTGSRAAFDVHPAGWDYILDRDVPILVTEGVKKADALLAAAQAQASHVWSSRSTDVGAGDPRSKAHQSDARTYLTSPGRNAVSTSFPTPISGRMTMSGEAGQSARSTWRVKLGPVDVRWWSSHPPAPRSKVLTITWWREIVWMLCFHSLSLRNSPPPK